MLRLALTDTTFKCEDKSCGTWLKMVSTYRMINTIYNCTHVIYIFIYINETKT